MQKSGPPSPPISRRDLMATTAFIPLTALTATAQQARPALSPEDMRVLQTFIDRLIPTDDLGPGAVDAGVHTYIDRTLAADDTPRKTAFIEGLKAVDAYSRQVHGVPFADLTDTARDTLIAHMESGTAEGFSNSKIVFANIRTLTLEGMFGDPHYGGNRNFAGWDLIRYPGPRLAVAPEDQALHHDTKPYRKSAWTSDKAAEHAR